MPLFNFQCYNCGLQFDSFCKKEEIYTTKCKSCSEISKPILKGNSFSFDENIKSPLPQNTGVSSIDHDFDRVIAEDSYKKWKIINKRNIQKHKLLGKKPNLDGENIQLMPDGEYVVVDNKKKKGLQKIKKDYLKPVFDDFFENH